MPTITSFSLLFLILIISSIVFTHPASPRIHRICGKKALRYIREICPGMCDFGESPDLLEYCTHGFSDWHVKQTCCPWPSEDRLQLGRWFRML